ncbi:MAG TPA: hypothetical protein VFQ65_25855 [Kofleriaceae bacterium]|nr:hypothetical protein [Kofleriaceae bacterium]
MRTKFRETLWFKKGQQDAAVAETIEAGDAMAPDKVDLLPIEDRYQHDQGGLSPSDSVAFGLHTGRTEYMPKLGAAPVDGDEVDEGAIVRDLKRGRAKVIAMIGAGAAVIVAVVIAFAS